MLSFAVLIPELIPATWAMPIKTPIKTMIPITKMIRVFIMTPLKNNEAPVCHDKCFVVYGFIAVCMRIFLDSQAESCAGRSMSLDVRSRGKSSCNEGVMPVQWPRRTYLS